MRFRYTFRPTRAVLLSAILLSANLPIATAAPRVRFDTVLGDIDVELLHEEAPQTVTNFLNYIVTDRYDESFIHRSEPGFVIQGGGYRFPAGSDQIEAVTRFDAVMNEPGVSNTRGTMAMAKLPDDPNSATSEFFFNVGDNLHLNTQNEGFTVFARVIGDGMTIVDEINDLQRVNVGSPFNTLPVHDYTLGNPVTRDNLVFINDVQVLPTGISGDYNANGAVEQGDLDLVLLHWGEATAPLPNGWFQDLPAGTIDQNELDGVLLNWGNTAANVSPLAPASVPEPSTWLLIVTSFVVIAFRRFV